MNVINEKYQKQILHSHRYVSHRRLTVWSYMYTKISLSHAHTTSHTHAQTHTHTHTIKQARPSSRSAHSGYLWGVYFSWSFLGPTKQTKEEGQEHHLHLGTLVVLLEKLRVSWLLERLWIGSTFYRIHLLAEYMLIKQWLITRSWWPKRDPLISWLAAEHFGILCFLYKPCVISFT